MQPKTINQPRIILVAGLILLVTTICTGLMAFLLMVRHAENLLSKSLQLSLQNKVAEVETEIRQRVGATTMVATRPFLIEQVQQASAVNGDTKALQALERGVKSFVSSGFSAIAIYSSGGQELARAGNFERQPKLTVPLVSAKQAHLLWNGGFVLHVRMDMLNDGHKVGEVIAEAPLSLVNDLFSETDVLGKTEELVLCAPGGTGMQCFPSRLSSRTLTLGTQSASGKQLPMAHALAGETGFVMTQDYRQQQVVAAYSPVKSLGLGMVLKMDRAELYAPVWHQAYYLLPILAGVLAAAILLLRWQLSPLVARLVRSEQKARETIVRLHDSESRMQAMLNNVDEGVVTMSETGVVELFNPGAERLFGFSREDVIGKNVSILMPEPYQSEHDTYIEHYLRTSEARIIGIGREVTARRKNGETFPVDLRVSEFFLAGRRHFIGVMRDITQRKAAEAQILHLANHDALTGLPNRNLIQDRIQQAIARAPRSGVGLAVMFIDLDRFKNINDTLGHSMGDLLLKEVAGRIRACLREEDTVGRQGGDEFIVLLASLDKPQGAAVVANKILSALSAPYPIGGEILHTSASIGIAVYPDDGSDVETLLKNSDTAMYQAKESGRNNYRFFDRV